jgi:hypothetical protein
MSAPIPLSQLGGGGDNTMMYVGILACCCCLVSSSGAGAAFVMSRKKSGATRASKMSRRAPGPSRAPRPRRAPRRAPRRIPKFKFRKPRFGKRRRKRGGGRLRRRPRFRMRRRCFSPETPVKLQNGETRAMKNIELGDILVNGSIVKATMQIKNESDPYYKLPGNILVTGSHYIKDGDTYKHVKKYTGAEATTQVDPIVSCLITNDHKIPVGDFIFWDWEDNLVHQ